MFKKTTYLAAVAVLALSSLGANKAEAADTVALTRIVNTSSMTIGFEYRFGNGPWQSVRLNPGGDWLMWANFTYPGSYSHDTIQIRFDNDLRPGYDNYQTFLPMVRYAPYANANLAQTYYFTYSGPNRQFLGMFPAP